jgi:hypothetical protein
LPRFKLFSLCTASIHANIPAISSSVNLDPSRTTSPGLSHEPSAYSSLISDKSISSHKFSSSAFLADKIIFVIADGLLYFSSLLLDDPFFFFFLNHVKIDLGDDLHQWTSLHDDESVVCSRWFLGLHTLVDHICSLLMNHRCYRLMTDWIAPWRRCCWCAQVVHWLWALAFGFCSTTINGRN